LRAMADLDAKLPPTETLTTGLERPAEANHFLGISIMTNSHNYFKVFCQISTLFQASANREVILKHIVESARQAMNVKACSLFLIRSRSEADGPFYPAAQVGLSENYIHSGPAKQRDITKDIIMKGGYMAVRDATADPRVENHEAKKREGIASMLIVPVIADHDPIGILVLYTAEPRDFDEQEREFAQALAVQGGIAILRSHRDYRSKRNMELLASVSETLNSSLDIKVVLHLMTSEITLAFDLLGVSIRLLDDHQLRLVASYGLSEGYLEKGPISTERLRKLISNKWEMVEDISASSIEYREERLQEGIVSMLHLPISIKNTSIGIMGLYNNKKKTVAEEDISLMASIARQCGLAIQNASLYLQLQQDKKNLEEEIWGHKAWF